MAYIDLTEDDVTSAARAMQRAGVLEIVLPELNAAGFTLAEFLIDVRTPKRLVRMRHVIWRRTYDTRSADGERLYSTTELGRLFNREHTTIITGILRAA